VICPEFLPLSPACQAYTSEVAITTNNCYRPGFGGSTPVPIPQRIPIFLETVPALLSHLNIKHISIASHSAGTIYALNVLSHLPNLLSPSHPSITLLSPWVHQSISSVSFLSAAAKLPNSLLNQWDSLTGFIINRAGPAVESSSGVLGSFMGMFSNRGDAEEPEDVEDEERRCKETIGMGLDVKIKLERLIFKYTFAENTKGANDEARLCLKSVDGSGWDKCEDYNAFVQELKGFWEQRVKENGAKKLRVKIVFAEEDAMIGKKGRKYFEDCWTKELCGDGVEVELVELKGGDHDSVVDPSKGIMGDMLAAVKAGGAE